MIIVFLSIMAAAAVLLCFASKENYGEIIEIIDSKKYPLKWFIPPALHILDTMGYRYTNRYDRQILAKITEVYGFRHSQNYLKIHHANRIVIFTIGLLFVAFIGSIAKIDIGFGVFSISFLAAIAYLPDKSMDDRVRKKRMCIRADFPDFVNKFTLLVSAGLTVTKSWEKVVIDNKKESSLYEELEMVLTDISSGISEQRAYENFAKRCRAPEITRFVSVMLQNARKGSSEIVSVLRIQGNECWEMRKNTARRLGEEASTKMLLPLMLMFIAVLLITTAPAVLVMRGIL